MAWDGSERRRENLDYCDHHLSISSDVAVIKSTIVNLDKRINGSLQSIEDHMDQGNRWRLAIIGIAVTLFIQFFGLIWAGSRVVKQVEMNTECIHEIQNLHPRIEKYEARKKGGKNESGVSFFD